jgi:hypothetical protein
MESCKLLLLHVADPIILIAEAETKDHMAFTLGMFPRARHLILLASIHASIEL